MWPRRDPELVRQELEERERYLDGLSRPYRYGDFPWLFWDLKPDEEVDGENLRVIARVLTDGRMADLRRLAPIATLLREFPRLDLPEHAQKFWSIVVRMLREREGLAAAE
ncbi:MAG TPA: hypothetical protein VFQ45_19085 [Longimicrobium sp.]|nr:hypothetical protein [Longimicrobium sp.]